MLKIPIKEALKGVEYCIENSESFMKDISIMLKAEKLDHISIPLQFALEEVGKAKILLDKIRNSKDAVLLDKKDGFLDHTVKLKIVSNMLDIPDVHKMLVGMVFGDDPEDHVTDPLAIDMINNEIKGLRTKAMKGHQYRISSSFVDFDRLTGEPKLEHTLTKQDVLILFKALVEIHRKIRSEYLLVSSVVSGLIPKDYSEVKLLDTEKSS